MSPVHIELDGGSYLAHYGIRNPWTLWLLRQAPELLGHTPTTLRTRDLRPICPACWLYPPQRMLRRGAEWVCYKHDPPVRRRAKLDVPDLEWADGQPSALSLIGKDVDVVYMDDLVTGEKGYVVVPFKETSYT